MILPSKRSRSIVGGVKSGSTHDDAETNLDRICTLIATIWLPSATRYL